MGYHIVEYEQHGSDRVKYGERLLEHLTKDLRQRLGRGFAQRNLRNFRGFYRRYPIRQSLIAEFGIECQSTSSEPPAPLDWQDDAYFDRLFHELPWTHFLELIRMDAPLKRSFYEVESLKNRWSVRELKRQVASLLYERVSLSRDQAGVLELAKEGKLVRTPADLIRDPYVFEFLGLKREERYSELTINGKQWTMNRVKFGVPGEFRGTFSLGWDGERRLFDFSGLGPDGRPVDWFGVYEFEGEVFKVCYRVRSENDLSRQRADRFGTWAYSSRVYNKFRRVSEPTETRKGVATSDVPRPMTTGFESRGSGSRPAMLASGGGTVESERAVAAALGWIAWHQSSDGSWNCKHFSKQCTDPSCQRHVGEIDKNSAAAQEYPTAATAFGLLPYLAAGMTPKSEGPYQDVIRKGLLWMTTHQDQKTGRLGTGNMYEHGLGTIAICEAYGLSKDAKLRPLAQAAVRFTEDAQNDKSGGWHYVANPPTDGDTSVLGWQFMSLRSAQMAGLQVNPQTLEKAQRFLRTVARGKNGGLSAYSTSAQPTPSMTAIGLLCRQYDGKTRSAPAMVEGMNYLLANPPHSAKNCYYWFYATQVMHNFSGPEWQDWNDRARELWIATQIKEGCAAGSWSLEGHNDVAGPLMITSLNALNLEVYYRSRPLYQADRVTNR